jgi:type II secretory pathway component GspD/PulD (secretin)
MVTIENVQHIKDLQQQVKKIFEQYRFMEKEHAQLKMLHQQLEVEKLSAMNEAETLREQLKTVKLAQALSGAGDQDQRQLKLQINSYIREIDRCLALLNKD